MSGRDIIIGVALFLTIFGVRLDGAPHTGFVESVWQTLLRILDTGTMASDQNWPLRISSIFVTLCGIFLATALIGVIATALDRKIEDLSKGRSFVAEEGHTVILGWSSRVFTVVSELCIANENQADPVIVLLAPLDKTVMEDAPRARISNYRGTRVVCRTGEPSNPGDLIIVNTAAARSIVVLAEAGRAGDAAAVKSVLAVMSNSDSMKAQSIVAELADSETVRALREASGGAGERS